ncbi:hypothetical protein [Streptomyces sp. NPDC006012]|uniref:hypothetical protein n=1 Tax=Streptomyces sp. NPDC006012 TaxID=3364739 RepID=UPI0036CD8F51
MRDKTTPPDYYSDPRYYSNMDQTHGPTHDYSAPQQDGSQPDQSGRSDSPPDFGGARPPAYSQQQGGFDDLYSAQPYPYQQVQTPVRGQSDDVRYQGLGHNAGRDYETAYAGDRLFGHDPNTPIMDGGFTATPRAMTPTNADVAQAANQYQPFTSASSRNRRSARSLDQPSTRRHGSGHGTSTSSKKKKPKTK